MSALLPANLEQLRFDSEPLPETDRFGAYRDFYSFGSDAQRLDGVFRATVQGFRLDRALLYDRTLSGVGHERGVQRVAADAFDHFTLTYVREGSFRIDAAWGEYVAVAPGELVLLDMARPMRNLIPRGRIITMSVARERVAATGAELDALHGLVLPVEAAGLLGDYLVSLTRRLPMLPALAVPAATKPVATLLAIALAGAGAAKPVDEEERIRRLIDAELPDPRFGPAALVELSGLSRATLYRLFQAQGGLAQVIQRRRLDRVRLALADAADQRPFAAIAQAAGFASDSHCSRLFFDAFGKRPGEYRAFHQPVASPAVPIGRMEYWHDEVS